MAISYLGKWLFNNKLLRTASVLSSNVSMTLPLSNLKLPQRSRVARFAGVANIELGIDLGSAQAVNMVAWAGSNLRTNAFFQVSHNSVNTYATSTLALAGSHVRTVQEPGGLALDQVNFALFDTATARYWWLYLDDNGNPDGYLNLGVLALGTFVEFDPNFNRDLAIGFEHRGRIERTAGGTPVTDRLLSPRQLSLSYDGMTSAQAWNNLVSRLQQMAGTDIWFIPFPLATGNEKYETALYGQVTTLPTATIRTNTPSWTVGRITLTESL